MYEQRNFPEIIEFPLGCHYLLLYSLSKGLQYNQIKIENDSLPAEIRMDGLGGEDPPEFVLEEREEVKFRTHTLRTP